MYNHICGLTRIEQAGEHNTNGESWWRQHHDLGLPFIRRNKRSSRYRRNDDSQKPMFCLENHLCNSARKLSIGKHWVFQRIHDLKHTSRQTSEWLNRRGVTFIEWSGQSPDLNPRENLWKELKIKVGER